MSFKLGKDAKIYYSTTGQTGTFLELTNVKDLTLNLDTETADVTTRANAGWKATAASLKDASVEWEMVWDTDDAGFTAIKDAFFNNTTIGLKVLDAAVADSGQGLLADFMIEKFSRSEPLGDALKVSVTARPTYSDTPPSWID